MDNEGAGWEWQQQLEERRRWEEEEKVRREEERKWHRTYFKAWDDWAKQYDKEKSNA